MLGFEVGTSSLVVLSVRQAQFTARSRFPFPSAFDRKSSFTRRNREADQIDFIVKRLRVDDVGLIQLDIAYLRDQRCGVQFKYVGRNEDANFPTATTRPVVPAICRACLGTR